MNRLCQMVSGMWKTGLVAAAGGTVLASSCSTSEVKAVLAGVELVTDQLSNRDDDLNFGDWLSSELDD